MTNKFITKNKIVISMKSLINWRILFKKIIKSLNNNHFQFTKTLEESTRVQLKKLKIIKMIINKINNLNKLILTSEKVDNLFEIN